MPAAADRSAAMVCPVCGIADVRDTADGGWCCKRCGSSDKRLNL